MMEMYWKISHNADCCETGLPMQRTYLKTVWEGFPAQRDFEDKIVNDWCRERFGPEVVYVQGVAATPSWSVCESCERDFKKCDPIVWGGYVTDTHQVVLGIGDHEKVNVHLDRKIEGGRRAI